MSSKIRYEYCNLDDCNRNARYLEGYFDCRKQTEPLCQIIDVRLAHIQFEETRCAVSLEKLKEMSRLVQTGLMNVNDRLAFGTLTLPETSRDFLHFLRDVHARIFSSTGLKFAGKFRQIGEPKVFVGHNIHQIEGLEPEKIEDALSSLFDSVVNVPDYSKVDRKTLLRHAARFLEGFFRIHPFHDGNGRVGRLTIRLMAQTTDRFMFKSFPDDKRARDRYVKSLEYAHQHVGNTDIYLKKDPFRPLESWLSTYLEEGIDLDEALPPEWMSEEELS
jgi:fido (protein-threonine AMPylation protein)